MLREIRQESTNSSKNSNKLRPEDRAVHRWYRFVLSFPPHLVQDHLDLFAIDSSCTVLDPFCGTGTTLVECKKQGIASIGLEPNPMAHFASSLKVDWSVDSFALSNFADEVAASARSSLEIEGLDDCRDLPLFLNRERMPSASRMLSPEQFKLLLKNSISLQPLHKSLVLLDKIDGFGDPHLQRYGRLALANALVHHIGNLKFGPEVGVGHIKEDAPVLDAWLDCMHTIIQDIRLVRDRDSVSARVIEADSREADRVLEPHSIDAVITSPPYPNEKDYTRTTRLESVILGLIRNSSELRSLKKGLIRSNTRGVYKSDTDDREVCQNRKIQELAESIESRRIQLGKTSGFERLYPRVTQLYFGGMRRHLASLRTVLKPNAKLAYVVGDQASYLRVLIRTGNILADLARSLGYEVTGIELFRTRPSTTTGAQLREEVLLLEWSGS